MSLKELRELTRNLDIKKKEFQKLQSELKLKEQLRLYSEASERKKKIQDDLQPSAHLHLENFFSRIRFDYMGLSLLAAIIACECFYLSSNGIISSPLQRGKYQVTVSTGEDSNRIIAATVDKLMREVKSRKQPPALAQLFNTGNQEKINSFMKETDSLQLKTIVYVKNEDCYYASALTDKDRNISFRLNRIADDYKISSIDIED
ncbi:MAG: hypothetical protein WCS96_13620 [Victivallales bacterium]|jgi:hypothetical protein